MLRYLPLLFLISCAALKPLPKQALACEESAIISQLPSLSVAAAQALQAPTRQEAMVGLDALVLSQGQAAICAISAVVADLEAQQSNAVAPALAGPVALSVQLSRACEWQAAQSFRARPPSARPLVLGL